jgi:hypothetical protein
MGRREETGNKIWDKERDVRIARNRERNKPLAKINKRMKG